MITGAPGYLFSGEAATGLALFKIADDGPPMWLADLPPVLNRYQRGAGVVYTFSAPWGSFHADARDLHKGESWQQLEVPVAKRHREAAALAVQQAAASSVPLGKLSPRITEGAPPLAPTLAPATDDPERGRAAWSWLAAKLAPAGRLTVGAALAAPWLEPAGTASSIWALTGEGGAGKSTLGLICATLFGSIDPDEGLVRGLNTSAQGLTSWVQELAHFPCVLDELQSATADIVPQMVSLVTGASRLRAGRSGASAASRARWGGLAIVTANDPLGEQLTPEMFDRRLVEIDATDLWQPPPANDEEWWNTIYEALGEPGLPGVLQGWPWQAISHQFPPGPAARGFVKRIKALPLPGRGNVGMLGRAAYAGAAWLAEWTGNPAWLEGVWDAAVGASVVADERRTDPARDAARAIIDHRAAQPGWTEYDRERVGFPVDDYDQPCEISHPEMRCDWWDIPAATFAEMIPGTVRRLTPTRFRRALATHRTHRVSRSEIIDGRGRVEVYRACLSAVSMIAWPDDDTPSPADPPPIPEIPSPQGNPRCVGCGQPCTTTHAGYPLHPTCDVPETQPSKETPAPASSLAPLPEAAAVVYGSTTDPDPAAALAAAVKDGTTDLTGPATWTPEAVAAAGWDTHGWQGLGASAARVSRGGHELRIRRDPDPADHAAALEDFAAIAGRHVETSPARLAVSMLREFGADSAGRTPRWNLPDELSDLWPGSDVAQVRQWGTEAPGHTSWDRNLSYLPAITQARVAPLWAGEEYRRIDGADVPDPSGKLAGMWRIIVPEWDRPDLPSPMGTIDPGRALWTTTERMRLYHARGIQPRVLEAVLAPAHKVTALERWSDQVKTWLAAAENRPGRTIAKALYQTLAGRIAAEWARGRRYDIYRPDWSWAIIDNSWCSVLRKVYAIADAGGPAPSRVLVDAVAYPGTEAPDGLPVGAGLGQFHREG